MLKTKPSPTYFFDASAVVKFVLSEPGSRRVQRMREETGSVYTSWVLLAEALGVLKRKWQRQEIDDQRYNTASHYLFTLIRDGTLDPVDVDVVDGSAALLTFEY